jgi:uncharacterized protein (DUF1684 family)
MALDELAEFRRQKDEFFRTHSQSPLTREQKQRFNGLAYFPDNPALRLETSVQPIEIYEEVEMQTTGGDVQVYRRYGRVAFQVDGQDAALTIYANENGYFLPFVDGLRGKETYPAGRYLEPEELPGGRFLIDFNLAYNPYCAYNPRWSCPLTPFENRTPVEIRAGEKIPSPEWAESYADH